VWLRFLSGYPAINEETNNILREEGMRDNCTLGLPDYVVYNIKPQIFAIKSLYLT
jgi:hypothetical protein